MLLYLLALLLLLSFLYIVYHMNFLHREMEDESEDEQHYTFKI